MAVKRNKHTSGWNRKKKRKSGKRWLIRGAVVGLMIVLGFILINGGKPAVLKISSEIGQRAALISKRFDELVAGIKKRSGPPTIEALKSAQSKVQQEKDQANNPKPVAPPNPEVNKGQEKIVKKESPAAVKIKESPETKPTSKSQAQKQAYVSPMAEPYTDDEKKQLEKILKSKQ